MQGSAVPTGGNNEPNLALTSVHTRRVYFNYDTTSGKLDPIQLLLGPSGRANRLSDLREIVGPRTKILIPAYRDDWHQSPYIELQFDGSGKKARKHLRALEQHLRWVLDIPPNLLMTPMIPTQPLLPVPRFFPAPNVTLIPLGYSLSGQLPLFPGMSPNFHGLERGPVGRPTFPVPYPNFHGVEPAPVGRPLLPVPYPNFHGMEPGSANYRDDAVKEATENREPVYRPPSRSRLMPLFGNKDREGK